MGRRVVCSRKGRCLQQAYPHAVKALRAAYDEANLWDSQSLAFDGDSVLWREAQGAVRLVYLAALRKIDFLNHLIWLLARLGEPGVKARCLELWAAAPGAEHHRVSAIFLSPYVALRALVEAISEDCSNVAPALQHEIDALAGVPMDDTAAEGPHSIVKRIKSSATAANFPWLSSSARMEQNIIDVEGLREGRGASSLQAVWDSFTSVLRPPQHRPSYQLMRMNRKEFERRVYTIQHMEGFSVDIEDDDDDDDGDAGGDGHDGSAG